MPVPSFPHQARIDMFGALCFMNPSRLSRGFMAVSSCGGHLVTPNPSASDRLRAVLLRKARLLKWNVETIAFSPNGFQVATSCSKILLCASA